MFGWIDFFSDAPWNLWKEGEPVWAILGHLEETLLRWTFPTEEKILLGPGTVVEPGVHIQGPCLVGENCLIRRGAYLRGAVLIGDGCVVGHASEIKNSILLEGARAAHLNYVGDSILGKGVNLGAGVKCANVRFDRREIRIDQVSTGLRKLGSIIGDGCQIGCNSVLNPGTLMGKNCLSYPLLNVHGVIPPRTRIRGKGDDLEFSPVEVEILENLR